MKNPLLKELWAKPSQFEMKTICHPNAYHNQAYLTKYKDLIEQGRSTNQQGFRSHYDYLDLPKDTFKIGFFGCSVTEGIGLCEEHTWTDMFLKEFQKRYNKNAIGLNFGKAGCSNDYITWNIEKACEEIVFDLICVQFTQIERRTFAKPDKSIYKRLPHRISLPFVNLIFTDKWGPLINGNIDKNDYTRLRNWIDSNENNSLNTLNNIRLVKAFLEKKNVPFILNKINDQFNDRKKSCSTYYEINSYDTNSIIQSKNPSDWAYSHALDWKKGRGGHPGIAFHEEFSKIYIKQYEEMLEKD